MLARVARSDLHQHLWPEPLVALARRSAAPRLRRGGAAGCSSSPASARGVDLADHDPPRAPAARARRRRPRARRAVRPLGIEALPAEEAEPLLDAFHAGVLELGAPFGLWARSLADAGPPRGRRVARRRRASASACPRSPAPAALAAHAARCSSGSGARRAAARPPGPRRRDAPGAPAGGRR